MEAGQIRQTMSLTHRFFGRTQQICDLAYQSSSKFHNVRQMYSLSKAAPSRTTTASVYALSHYTSFQPNKMLVGCNSQRNSAAFLTQLPNGRQIATTGVIDFYPRNLPQKTYNRRLSNKSALPQVPVFLHAEKHVENPAIVDREGLLKYGDILHHSMTLAVEILTLFSATESMKLNGERIALLTEPNAAYVVGLYASWICNGISVPLHPSHPASEWEYFLSDSQCSLVLVSETFFNDISPVAEKLGIKVKLIKREDIGESYDKNRWLQPDHASNPKKVRKQYESRRQRWFDKPAEQVMQKPAVLIYTSGTTGRPKGVVLTHRNLSTMVSGMHVSWGWSSRDVILCVLPLHHVHGLVNIVLTSLASGAVCVMEPKFEAAAVWNLLTAMSLKQLDRNINLFMAVPTVYVKLMEFIKENVKDKDDTMTAKFLKLSLSQNIRLMVCGSAAMPKPVSQQWQEISGHHLLERYGMSETGMILSHPLHGERVVGSVGVPLPEVEVQIARPNVYSPLGYDVLAEGDSRRTIVTKGCEGEQGELLVRGPAVFKEYWNKPEETQKTFTKDGWFKTGDTVKYENGAYFIVGRTSVDVIKNGGYKISALGVEQHLLEHPDIVECTVVGLPDITWGQRVAAIVTLKAGTSMELSDLRSWAAKKMPPYQIPTVLKVIESIPRNAMGKVNKKEIVRTFFPETLDKN